MQAALMTRDGSVVPWSTKLRNRLTKVDAFGEPYEMFHVVKWEDEPALEVPRGLVKISKQNDWREDGIAIDCSSQFVPHPKKPEQKGFNSKCVALLKGGSSFIAKAPTGFGKTYCGADIACRIGRRTMVLTTKEDIIDQWVEAFVNVAGADESRPGSLVHLAQLTSYKWSSTVPDSSVSTEPLIPAPPKPNSFWSCARFCYGIKFL